MRLTDYLRQADADPDAALRPPVTQDEQLVFGISNSPRPGYWNEIQTTIRKVQDSQYTDSNGQQLGDAVPLPYTTYTGCFVWVEQFQTVDIGDDYLNWRYLNQIPQRQIRDFTLRKMACPWPTKRGWISPGGVALRLDLLTQSNGRWWSLTTAGDTCTTTTTTTQPPCDCSTHPPMQFTISGVSLRAGAGQCNGNDQICNTFNRQWCLPFRSRTLGWWGSWVCEWSYTLSYNNGCPPGSLWYGGTSTQAKLRWPLYKVWNGSTYVCPAELDFGVYRYTSLDFSPDTGGTFTDGNAASPWAPTCIGWPSTLTVTANAGCNPDPPTTTTTTTTTTTSGPPGP